MVLRDTCPACGATRYKQQGHPRPGQQHPQGKAWGRQLTANALDRGMASEPRRRLEQLLCERLSLRGICRAVGVRLPWLLHFLGEGFAACPEALHVQGPTQPTAVLLSRLDAEAEAMWRLVQKKAHKQWLWIAMDAIPRPIIAFPVGDRSAKSGKALWAKIPLVSRAQATFPTDPSAGSQGVMPAAQHRAITKNARKTNHIERFNNTLRQRVSRLVRETLSGSKKLANHIGAIKYFICHYKLEKVGALPV